LRRKWSANGPRDRRVNRGLRKLGGRVMRIWEHDLAKRGKASVRRIQATLQGRRWSWDGGLRAEDRRPEARAQCCLVIRHAYRGFHEEWIKRGELRLGLFATEVPWCKAMAEYAAVARPPLCGRTTNLKREVCLKRARPHPGPLPRGEGDVVAASGPRDGVGLAMAQGSMGRFCGTFSAWRRQRRAGSGGRRSGFVFAGIAFAGHP
jgi:hypothetical protein